MSMTRATKVLVVDDEQAIAVTLAAILEGAGYQTATAFSGLQAIETAAKFRPNFLLSDIRMPGMNGVEAAIQILGFLPECSVLLISGYVADDVLAAARTRGFDFEVCSKPMPPPLLLGKIAEIVSRSH